MLPSPAQATLGPAKPRVRTRPARTRPAPTSLVVLVALIWTVPVAAMSMLGFLVLTVAVWGAASGVSPWPLLLGTAGVAAAGAAVLTGLYHLPFPRRMTPMGRLALLGVVVWPFPVLLPAHAMNG